jgi:hypothetical protein
MNNAELTLPTADQVRAMSVPLPQDETYVVTNTTVIDAPLDFVWEHFPRDADISRVMTPFRGFPGAKSWITTPDFNNKGSSIAYTMSNGLTITETIVKRENHHYVYGYQMPFRNFIFKFWQGNLLYKDAGNGQTELTWKYWLAPKDNLFGRFLARRIIQFIWRGYTRTGVANIKAEAERLYAQANDDQ